MGGDERGWQWADADGNMDINVVVRSTLNGLRVKNMRLFKANSSDEYMLCGAHRLNFAYHKVSRDKISANTGWGESTYANDTLLSKMNANGLATKSLFDPLGLVWLLLWKKEKRSAFDAKDDSYYMCAAHMHPHFADLITGILPERYDVCTATRWWNTGEDGREWYMAMKNPMNHTVEQIKWQMGTGDDWVDWVADKIRKPLFRIKLEGRIEESPELGKALTLEGLRAGSTIPLRKLIDILMYVYFDKPIEARTPKPVQPTPPTPPVPPDKADAASKDTGTGTGTRVPTGTGTGSGTGSGTGTGTLVPTGTGTGTGSGTGTGTGTGTPVPTGTGVPAKEESFWDKNQYYIIGGIIGGLVLLLVIFAFIVSRRRGRKASYEQLGYSDPGYIESLESLRDQGPEGLGEGPEGIELEGLGGEGAEDLGGEGSEDPTRFGF
jgi:hypothetical protein